MGKITLMCGNTVDVTSSRNLFKGNKKIQMGMIDSFAKMKKNVLSKSAQSDGYFEKMEKIVRIVLSQFKIEDELHLGFGHTPNVVTAVVGRYLSIDDTLTFKTAFILEACQDGVNIRKLEYQEDAKIVGRKREREVALALIEMSH